MQLSLPITEPLTEKIVVFYCYPRDIFNASTSFAEAVEKPAFLSLEGWADVSNAFGEVMAFLQEHYSSSPPRWLCA
jgi:hypothetical protein